MSEKRKMLNLVEECLKSGLHKKDFFRQKNISPHKYYYWQKRYLAQKGKCEESPVFKEVSIPAFFSQEGAPKKVLEVTTPSGTQIIIYA